MLNDGKKPTSSTTHCSMHQWDSPSQKIVSMQDKIKVHQRSISCHKTIHTKKLPCNQLHATQVITVNTAPTFASRKFAAITPNTKEEKQMVKIKCTPCSAIKISIQHSMKAQHNNPKITTLHNENTNISAPFFTQQRENTLSRVYK